ncbi:MAG: hypothetical protein GEV13_08915 [Rhodospirillales bacterium]|nr:hypothetical protein [Rhodospirillales bacterium]
MTVGPVYVKVTDGRRPLRVTACAKSRRRQLVRISAAEVPSKMSKVWWFEDRELRPAHQERVELDIPAVGLPSFWLVIHVFSTAGQGWHRSTVKAGASLQVPENDLFFDDDAGKDEPQDTAARGIVLSLEYRGTDDRG